MQVKVSRTAVDAVIKVGQVWPVVNGTSPVAYSLTIDGRRLDSFMPTGGLDGTPVVMDNGTGYYLPAGTATWDTTNNTVTFHVRRDYLADQSINAPYNVYAVTGYHARSNDWVANDDLAPNARNLDLAGTEAGPGDPRRPGGDEGDDQDLRGRLRLLRPQRLDAGRRPDQRGGQPRLRQRPDRLPVLGPGDPDLAGRRLPGSQRGRRVVPEGPPERRATS